MFSVTGRTSVCVEPGPHSDKDGLPVVLRICLSQPAHLSILQTPLYEHGSAEYLKLHLELGTVSWAFYQDH